MYAHRCRLDTRRVLSPVMAGGQIQTKEPFDLFISLHKTMDEPGTYCLYCTVALSHVAGWTGWCPKQVRYSSDMCHKWIYYLGTEYTLSFLFSLPFSYTSRFLRYPTTAYLTFKLKTLPWRKITYHPYIKLPTHYLPNLANLRTPQCQSTLTSSTPTQPNQP